MEKNLNVRLVAQLRERFGGGPAAVISDKIFFTGHPLQ
jgi:hypothetical protein